MSSIDRPRGVQIEIWIQANSGSLGQDVEKSQRCIYAHDSSKGILEGAERNRKNRPYRRQFEEA